MRYIDSLCKGLCLTGCALLTLAAPIAAIAQEKSIEEKEKIHRFTNTKHSIYDAFTYVNRIPEAAEPNESALEMTGRLFGRLANQEGRISLKLPPGMDKATYISFKTFFRYADYTQAGDAKIGNCAACHSPSEFSDLKKHVVTKGGSPTTTPSLRNIAKRKIDVAAVIRAKIKASEQKRSGKADDIDDAYAAMRLTEKDIPGLVKFIGLLNDAPSEDFRQLILDSELVDTSDMAGIN